VAREIARIEVNRDLCIGAGPCVEAAPSVFRLDEENRAVVIDVEGDPEDAIWEGAEECPTSAIYLYDAEGNQLYP
jgi:ferredoxin